jgi:hypothetical protein
LILDSIILVPNVLQFDFVCFIFGFWQVLVEESVAINHGYSCSLEAHFDQEPGMVVEEAPESGFHEVQLPYFVLVGYSLSTEEMAALQGLLVDAERTLASQEEIIMDYYKGDAQVVQYSEFAEAVDYSI